MTELTPDQYRALAERADDAGGYELNETTLVDEMAVTLRAAADEVNRLRVAIDSAPHAPECEQWDLQTQTGRPLTDRCTCWKASAL